jgi:hypothetical protein
MLAIGLVVVLAISIGIVATIYFQNQSIHSKSSSSAYSSSGITDGLQLSITLQDNKTVYSLGEQVNMTLTVTNVSNKTQTFVNLNANASLNYVVYNSNDTLIYQELFGAVPPQNGSVVLAPNENFTQTLDWPQQNIEQQFHQVPPGEYCIIGVTGVNTPHKLQTARLNITIVNN